MEKITKQKEILSEAYDKYKRMLLKDAYAYVHDYALAEDCVHEAFLALQSRMNTDTFEEISVHAFLSKVVRNTALKYLRNTSHEGADVGSPLEEFEIFDDSFRENMHRKENAELVLLALESLPPRSKSALLLFYQYGLSYKEIAQTVGGTEFAVKKLITRSMNALRESYFLIGGGN